MKSKRYKILAIKVGKPVTLGQLDTSEKKINTYLLGGVVRNKIFHCLKLLIFFFN